MSMITALEEGGLQWLVVCATDDVVHKQHDEHQTFLARERLV